MPGKHKLLRRGIEEQLHSAERVGVVRITGRQGQDGRRKSLDYRPAHHIIGFPDHRVARYGVAHADEPEGPVVVLGYIREAPECGHRGLPSVKFGPADTVVRNAVVQAVIIPVALAGVDEKIAACAGLFRTAAIICLLTNNLDRDGRVAVPADKPVLAGLRAGGECVSPDCRSGYAVDHDSVADLRSGVGGLGIIVTINRTIILAAANISEIVIVGQCEAGVAANAAKHRVGILDIRHCTIILATGYLRISVIICASTDNTSQIMVAIGTDT